MIIVSCLYLGLDLEGHHLKCGGVAEWFKAAVLKTFLSHLRNLLKTDGNPAFPTISDLFLAVLRCTKMYRNVCGVPPNPPPVDLIRIRGF